MAEASAGVFVVCSSVGASAVLAVYRLLAGRTGRGCSLRRDGTGFWNIQLAADGPSTMRAGAEALAEDPFAAWCLRRLARRFRRGIAASGAFLGVLCLSIALPRKSRVRHAAAARVAIEAPNFTAFEEAKTSFMRCFQSDHCLGLLRAESPGGTGPSGARLPPGVPPSGSPTEVPRLANR
jgi:hypothetical protein